MDDEPSIFVIEQWKQSVETYRQLFALTISIDTILVIANATIVGFAVDNQIASLFWVGTLFPITLVIVSRIMLRLMAPALYVAIQIEQKHGHQFRADWLASTFIDWLSRKRYSSNVRTITATEDLDQRLEDLRQLTWNIYRGPDGGLIKFVIYLTAIGQAVLPIILTTYAGWRLI